jgi:hypothetical protein
VINKLKSPDSVVRLFNVAAVVSLFMIPFFAYKIVARIATCESAEGGLLLASCSYPPIWLMASPWIANIALVILGLTIKKKHGDKVSGGQKVTIKVVLILLTAMFLLVLCGVAWVALHKR